MTSLLISVLIFAIVFGVAFLVSKLNLFQPSRSGVKEEIDDSLEYLTSKRPIERVKFTPSESVYTKFWDHYKETPALSAMAKEILKHLGLPNNSIPVYIVDELDENAAGSYSYGMYGTCIEIKIKDDTYPTEVFAILIHECMHYYLRLTRMGFPETHKNEVLTDTATIYFGFYEYMYEGYFRAGYINKNEMDYIEKELSDMGMDYAD